MGVIPITEEGVTTITKVVTTIRTRKITLDYRQINQTPSFVLPVSWVYCQNWKEEKNNKTPPIQETSSSKPDLNTAAIDPYQEPRKAASRRHDDCVNLQAEILPIRTEIPAYRGEWRGRSFASPIWIESQDSSYKRTEVDLRILTLTFVEEYRHSETNLAPYLTSSCTRVLWPSRDAA